MRIVECDGAVRLGVAVTTNTEPTEVNVESCALRKLRDICGNCRGLARLILPCGGTPTPLQRSRRQLSLGRVVSEYILTNTNIPTIAIN
jgi:hypothetical protein